MADIHPTAVVHPGAHLADHVKVGPFCVIGDHVVLGEGCVLHSNVTIEGPSSFGENNEFFPGCVIGTKSQDLKYSCEPTFLEVGNNNVFRENSNINRGTMPGTKTVVGNNNNFLVAAHVGHDCVVGDHVIISGYAAVAGHVQIGDYAIISGCSAIHQFVRIGEHSIIGGVSRVTQDIPPYTVSEGHPAVVRGINVIGLDRRGFGQDDIRALKQAYKKMFLHKGTKIDDAIEELQADPKHGGNPYLKRLIEFLKTSERGFAH